MSIDASRSLLRAGALVTGAMLTAVLLAGCGSSGPSAGSTGNSAASAIPTSSTSTSAHPMTTNPPAAMPNVVTLGGARLTLPAGWVAQFMQPRGGGGKILPTWCLSPTPLPSPTYVGQNCAATFSSTSSSNVLGGILLDVDTPGGIVSNPQYCGPGFQGTGALASYGDRRLGNRPADYRRWSFVCKDGKRWSIEQYVADNAPGFILFSDRADPTVHTALTSIAKSAVLPAMSGPLRLSDLGIVRTMTPLSGGAYHITLDRVVRGMTGLINNNPATYPYDLPATNPLGGPPPRTGALIEVFTNGNKVTGYQLPPA